MRLASLVKRLYLLNLLSVLALCPILKGFGADLVVTDPAPELALSLSPTYVSKNIFRGQQIAGPSFQIPLQADYGAFTALLFSCSDLKASSNLMLNFHTSYLFNIGHTLKLETLFNVFTTPREDTLNPLYVAGKAVGEQLYHTQYETGLGTEFTLYGFKLQPRYFYNTTIKGNTYELYTKYDLPLLYLGTEINFTAKIGAMHDKNLTTPVISQVPRGVVAYPLNLQTHYTVLGVSIPYQIKRSVSVKLGWYYNQSSSDLSQNLPAGTVSGVEKHIVTHAGVFSSQIEFKF